MFNKILFILLFTLSVLCIFKKLNENRNHRIISWGFRIWKRAIHTIGQCKRYNTTLMTSPTHWTDIKCSTGHFTQAHQYSGVVEVAAQACPFGIHIGNWFRSVKLVIDNAISIQSHVSANKLFPDQKW